jgi:hypothetical protein
MRVIFSIAIVLTCAAAVARAQAPTEEQRAAEMLREIAGATLPYLPAGSVRLSVSPDNAPPMVLQVFSESLAERQTGVATGAGHADYTLSVDVRGMNSGTDSHGNSSYLRTVSVSAGIFAKDNRTDSVLFSKQFDLVRRDTLDGEPVYAQKDLLSAGERSWIDGVLVPGIAAVAAVIIVVLLFTIRGS